MESLEFIKDHPLGWVMVFDMDQTLTGNYFCVNTYPNRKISLNPYILDVLKKSVIEREKGGVAAILLLTNNSDPDFISVMHEQVCDEILGFERKDKVIFDYIMDARHTKRSFYINPPSFRGIQIKSSKDVEYMLQQLGKTTEDLLQRIFFFDDQEYHTLVEELRGIGKHTHFFHIYPPFQGFMNLYILQRPKTRRNIVVNKETDTSVSSVMAKLNQLCPPTLPPSYPLSNRNSTLQRAAYSTFTIPPILSYFTNPSPSTQNSSLRLPRLNQTLDKRIV